LFGKYLGRGDLVHNGLMFHTRNVNISRKINIPPRENLSEVLRADLLGWEWKEVRELPSSAVRSTHPWKLTSLQSCAVADASNCECTARVLGWETPSN